MHACVLAFPSWKITYDATEINGWLGYRQDRAANFYLTHPFRAVPIFRNGTERNGPELYPNTQNGPRDPTHAQDFLPLLQRKFSYPGM